MAPPPNHLSLLFLLALIFSTQIQARESKFFSKFNHYQELNTTNGTTSIPTTNTGNGSTINTAETSPSPSPSPSNESLKETEQSKQQEPLGKQEEKQTSNGYGLYGSNQNPSTTAKTSQEYKYASIPNKASTDEYTGGSYEEEATTGGENDNKNNYGYKPKQFGMSDTRFMDTANVYNNNNNNGYSNNQYDTSFTDSGNNGYSNNQYDASFTESRNNGATTEKLGMSDTRFNNNNDGYSNSQYDTSFTGSGNNGYSNTQYDTSFTESGNNGATTEKLGMSDTRFLDNSDINNNNNNNNNGFGDKQYSSSYTGVQENDNNGFGDKEFDPNDSKFSDNGNTNNNNNNGYETEQYQTSNNLPGVEQQGASDTRFMKNGKYFYNVNNENSYLNDYRPESRSYDESSSSQKVAARNNNNYSNNNENAYQFSNSMGESQYQNEENQQKFSP